MDISTFFSPVDLAEFPMLSGGEGQLHLGNVIQIHSDAMNFPDFSNAHLAIIGVKEDRNSKNNEGCANAADIVRKYLYCLFPGNYKIKLADLGNIKRGFDINDTYFAVKSVVAELIQNKIIPIIRE